MKKTITILLVAGTAALTYLALRKKYRHEDEEQQQPAFHPRPKYKKHHITNVFSNAKKYAMHKTHLG